MLGACSDRVRRRSEELSAGDLKARSVAFAAIAFAIIALAVAEVLHSRTRFGIGRAICLAFIALALTAIATRQNMREIAHRRNGR